MRLLLTLTFLLSAAASGCVPDSRCPNEQVVEVARLVVPPDQLSHLVEGLRTFANAKHLKLSWYSLPDSRSGQQFTEIELQAESGFILSMANVSEAQTYLAGFSPCGGTDWKAVNIEFLPFIRDLLGDENVLPPQ